MPDRGTVESLRVFQCVVTGRWPAVCHVGEGIPEEANALPCKLDNKWWGRYADVRDGGLERSN